MKIASNKIKDILRYFRDELKHTYPSEELDSIITYCFEDFLNLKRSAIISNQETTVSESELLKFNYAIKELKKFKPLQYILGEADFYHLKFYVNEHVLIPRPETEELVQLIIQDNKIPAPSILDIGTGSGCISVALKKNIPLALVSALDVSESALKVAKRNAEKNGSEILFILSDILDPLACSELQSLKYDIIVSNPPYICISEKDQMHKNVLEYEPHLALFVNDNNPLLFYNVICDFALNRLHENGKLYFEINQSFAFETKHLLESKGFKNVELIKDLSNNYRILRGNIR
jgi:release factor glutamine methyltransferase